MTSGPVTDPYPRRRAMVDYLTEPRSQDLRQEHSWTVKPELGPYIRYIDYPASSAPGPVPTHTSPSRIRTCFPRTGEHRRFGLYKETPMTAVP